MWIRVVEIGIRVNENVVVERERSMPMMEVPGHKVEDQRALPSSESCAGGSDDSSPDAFS